MLSLEVTSNNISRWPI